MVFFYIYIRHNRQINKIYKEVLRKKFKNYKKNDRNKTTDQLLIVTMKQINKSYYEMRKKKSI